jgi:hypothetical protein
MTESEKKPAPVNVGAGALNALVNKYSKKASDGGAPRKIARRTAVVTIPVSVCEPDTFEGDVIEIGLEGVDSSSELQAMSQASDGASAGFAMARRALKTLNGASMKRHEADLVWEALGFAGRALVVNKYLTDCTGAGGADLGKSLENEEA